GIGHFSVDRWVNFNSTSGEQVLAEKFLGESGPGWTLTKLSNNRLHFYFANNNVTSGDLSIPAGTWIHFAARRSGTTASIFMNGAILASGSWAGNVDSSSSLRFGSRGGVHYFLNDLIDEVGVYNRALSDAEVQAICNSGAAG